MNILNFHTYQQRSTSIAFYIKEPLKRSLFDAVQESSNSNFGTIFGEEGQLLNFPAR